MHIIAKVKVKAKTQHTHYFWGPLSEIEGQELRMIEKNEQGDCLCIAPQDKGLVDVNPADVESIKTL